MAEKKTTKRERREDAKRRRVEELKRRQRQARNRKLAMWTGGLLAVAGIVAAVLLLIGGGKSDAELKRVATAAGCAPIKSFPVEGRDHVSPPQTVNYKTNPPTSGNHYGQWANTGIHTTPVPNENQVHNLEHGAIVIQFKSDLDPQILTALEDVVRKDPKWILLAPSTTIPSPLTFSAWQHYQLCNSPTTPAAVTALVNAFIDERKGKGPESIAGTPIGV